MMHFQNTLHSIFNLFVCIFVFKSCILKLSHLPQLCPVQNMVELKIHLRGSKTASQMIDTNDVKFIGIDW